LLQLENLFSRLRNVGLKAKLPKCEFGANNVQYLGFTLIPEGILPGVDKLKLWETQKPQEQLRRSGNSQVFATFSEAT
jgi:hypothetical protein